MRILFLTRYDRLGASTRVRALQYLRVLEAGGIGACISPFTDDRMLLEFYATGRRSSSAYIRVMLRRLWILRSARNFDLLWIEKELFPFLPPWLERFLLRRKIPYVVDYDDAIFHNYDQHKNSFIRQLLKDKIAVVMRSAAAVFAGNEYIANYAKGAGAGRVEYLPTVVDTSRYTPGLKNGSEQLRIGWIGTPNTSKYLSVIKDVLPALSSLRPVQLVLVGASRVHLQGIPVEIHPWTEETEVDEIKAFDIGIMPLFDGPIERGKCGYKLIQYGACGLPVVASPIGANRRIVKEGVNGFLASNTESWISGLRALINDTELRHRLGSAGRTRIEKEYSLQVFGPRLVDILRDLSKKRGQKSL